MQIQVRVRIAGRSFRLDPHGVERALDGVLPEPVRDHFVVVAGRRFPPKQVISEVTGLDRADFTTHQARSVLRRLGFSVARRTRGEARPSPATSDRSLPYGGRQAEALRPHVGKWVAVRDAEVLVAADAFDEVVGWLERYDQQADMVFRVPRAPEDTDLPMIG